MKGKPTTNNQVARRAQASHMTAADIVAVGPLHVNRKAALELGNAMGKENVRKAVDDARRWNQAKKKEEKEKETCHPVAGVAKNKNKKDDAKSRRREENAEIDWDGVAKCALTMGSTSRHALKSLEKPKAASEPKAWDHAYLADEGLVKDRQSKISLRQQKLQEIKEKMEKFRGVKKSSNHNKK